MAKLLFIFLFILFSFGLIIQGRSTGKCHIPECHSVTSKKKCDISHDECGKVVHRPCSSYISSVQEINKNSIKFSLSTWTWSRFKSPWLEPYSKG